MRLEKNTQIAVASSEPIRSAVKAWADEDNARRRYLGGHVSIQAEVNGLIVWLLSRPEHERHAIRDAGLDMLEQMELGRLSLEEVGAMGEPSGPARVVHGKPAAGDEGKKDRRKAR